MKDKNWDTCVMCGRDIEDGEDAILLNDPELVCLDCVKESTMTLYYFKDGDFIGTENDLEFTTVEKSTKEMFKDE